jgi:hypothetical protein
MDMDQDMISRPDSNVAKSEIVEEFSAEYKQDFSELSELQPDLLSSQDFAPTESSSDNFLPTSEYADNLNVTQRRDMLGTSPIKNMNENEDATENTPSSSLRDMGQTQSAPVIVEKTRKFELLNAEISEFEKRPKKLKLTFSPLKPPLNKTPRGPTEMDITNLMSESPLSAIKISAPVKTRRIIDSDHSDEDQATDNSANDGYDDDFRESENEEIPEIPPRVSPRILLRHGDTPRTPAKRTSRRASANTTPVQSLRESSVEDERETRQYVKRGALRHAPSTQERNETLQHLELLKTRPPVKRDSSPDAYILVSPLKPIPPQPQTTKKEPSKKTTEPKPPLRRTRSNTTLNSKEVNKKSAKATNRNVLKKITNSSNIIERPLAITGQVYKNIPARYFAWASEGGDWDDIQGKDVPHRTTWRDLFEKNNARQPWPLIINNVVQNGARNRQGPPVGFTWIEENIYSLKIKKPDLEFVTRCECQDNCDKRSRCSCSLSYDLPFAYTRDRTLVKDYYANSIVECGHKCSCNHECLNRTVQNGRRLPLVIFMHELKGWGVKTLVKIPAGTFVDEYTGEVIPAEEADKKAREDQKRGSTYLFDLDGFLGI